jgi:hypothetical protein
MVCVNGSRPKTGGDGSLRGRLFLISLLAGQLAYRKTYLTGIASPVLISSFAARTRLAVNRFSLPSPSFGPHTQAALGGAPGIEGRYFRGGNVSRSGFHGNLLSSGDGVYAGNTVPKGIGDVKAEATALRRFTCLDDSDMMN